MKKKPSISKLKKAVWKEFSLYIRLKYSDYRGYVTCYTCGIQKHYKDSMQAGHGFGGRHKAVLFMEEVVKPQCYGCNCMMGGKLDVFTHNLRKELGDKRFEQLYKVAHGKRRDQWTIEELQNYKDYYKKKLKELSCPTS